MLISIPSRSAVSGLVGEPEAVPKWRAPNYRSLPLGRIVGIPSLWPRSVEFFKSTGWAFTRPSSADIPEQRSHSFMQHRLRGQAAASAFVSKANGTPTAEPTSAAL